MGSFVTTVLGGVIAIALCALPFALAFFVYGRLGGADVAVQNWGTFFALLLGAGIDALLLKAMTPKKKT